MLQKSGFPYVMSAFVLLLLLFHSILVIFFLKMFLLPAPALPGYEYAADRPPRIFRI